MSKIILLNAPTAGYSSMPLLNLAYLSAVLKKAKHEVKVIDAAAPFKKWSEEEVLNAVKKFEPDLIGLTLTITYIPHTYKFIAKLKELGFPIMAGGPHANCLPEEVLNHGVDIVVIGEGDETVVDLANKMKLEDVKGICFLKNGKPHFTEPRKQIEDLDSLPYADFSEFPIENYTGSIDPHSNEMFWSIFSSRGCPFDCIFCASHNVFGRSYRSRSPRNVFDEVCELNEKYGATFFTFQDDETFIDKKRMIEFCKLVVGSQFRFSGRMRIDTVDAEMLDWMKKVGFARLPFGIESFNDDSLKKMNKMYNVEKIFKGLDILAESDFKNINIALLVGFPWETPEHFKTTLENMKKIPETLNYYCGMNTLVPFPGTKLYNDYHEQFGFTNWWLDEERNSKTIEVVNDSFWYLFLSKYGPLHAKERFWNFPDYMKQAIEKFCWDVAFLQLQRNLSSMQHRIIYSMLKLSYNVWKVAPLLEKLLFFIPKKCLFGIDKKADFGSCL